MTYRLSPEESFIETLGRGNLTFRDVMDHFRQLEADPRLPQRLDVLLDLGAVTSLPESGQLREVAGAVQRLRSKVEWGACAIVAGRESLYGMCRMFEAFAEDLFTGTQVFRDRRKAEDWLGAFRAPAGTASPS